MKRLRHAIGQYLQRNGGGVGADGATRPTHAFQLAIQYLLNVGALQHCLDNPVTISEFAEVIVQIAGFDQPRRTVPWIALGVVYVLWGSTYLAIALMVETMPPLLSAGARFVVVGLILLPFLAVKRGLAAIRPTRPQLLAAGFVGLMLPGANAVIIAAAAR